MKNVLILLCIVAMSAGYASAECCGCDGTTVCDSCCGDGCMCDCDNGNCVIIIQHGDDDDGDDGTEAAEIITGTIKKKQNDLAKEIGRISKEIGRKIYFDPALMRNGRSGTVEFSAKGDELEVMERMARELNAEFKRKGEAYILYAGRPEKGNAGKKLCVHVSGERFVDVMAALSEIGPGIALDSSSDVIYEPVNLELPVRSWESVLEEMLKTNDMGSAGESETVVMLDD